MVLPFYHPAVTAVGQVHDTLNGAHECHGIQVGKHCAIGSLKWVGQLFDQLALTLAWNCGQMGDADFILNIPFHPIIQFSLMSYMSSLNKDLCVI